MNVDVSFEAEKARMALRGRFDFSSRLDFSRGYEQAFARPDATEVVVDLREVEYMDSAALGMLLLLGDKGRAAGKAVSLAAKPGMVGDVLRIAKFDKLFELQMA
jgi:anti-anti-sigma factor